MRSVANLSESVRCVIIPLDGGAILLPNASVAEVVGYQAAMPIPSAPAWCLGRFQWRGLAVPLVAFERVIGGALLDIGHRARITVIYGLGQKAAGTPYYGLVAQGIPRLSRVLADGIQSWEDSRGHEAIAANVIVDGIKCWIPDMDAMTELVSAITP